MSVGDGKKVYVENLNYKTSWQDLKDHMKTAGTVTFAELFTKRSGASKGSGYLPSTTKMGRVLFRGGGGEGYKDAERHEARRQGTHSEGLRCAD